MGSMSDVGWLLSFDDLFKEGRFEEIDSRLEATDPKVLAADEILSLLSFTYWGKANLKARDRFVARCEAVLTERLGAERTARLLTNRRQARR